jgi:bacterial/archaeal transporter family protein
LTMEFKSPGKERNVMNWFIFALAAALLWGIAPIFGKMGLVKTDPLTALTIRTTGVAVALFFVNLFGARVEALKAAGPKTWVFLIAEGLGAGLFGHYAYLFALKYGKASSVVPITADYPIITIILGAVLLREFLTPGKIAGGLLVAAGVYLTKQF